MAQDDQQLVAKALAGDAAAVRALVGALQPVVQARVARTLLRRSGAARGREVRQELEDLVQEVYLSLFADDGRVLRAWDPARGLSLANFVGLVAERQAIAVLRSGRRSPWTEDPTEEEALDRERRDTGGPEVRVESRELLERLLDRLKAELSPKGLWLFTLLFVRERTVPEVRAETGMSDAAVYAWRSRLAKLSRRLAAELTVSEPQLPARTPERGGVP